MPCKTKTLILLIFSLFSIFAITYDIKSLVADDFYWSPNAYFGLPAYNSSVRFSNWFSFSNFTWNDSNASKCNNVR